MDDGERSAQQYDAMAAAYADDNLANACNASYERPATIALLGEVAGRRVLEVGCGAGPLTRWLVEHRADVTAIDVSPGMLGLARQRVGDAAAFLRCDVQEPLPFADGAFDLVVASLVLHYVEDWESVLSELRRVLGPNGSVVCSTHHPTMDWRLHSSDDYFAVRQVTETWEKAGLPLLPPPTGSVAADTSSPGSWVGARPLRGRTYHLVALVVRSIHGWDIRRDGGRPGTHRGPSRSA